jgi:hypothetical protein
MDALASAAQTDVSTVAEGILVRELINYLRFVVGSRRLYVALLRRFYVAYRRRFVSLIKGSAAD